MTIIRNFRGTRILKPGGYSYIDTSLLTRSNLGASGIVAIVGTAEGGEPNTVYELTGGQIQAAKDTFVDGAIAKVLDLLVIISIYTTQFSKDHKLKHILGNY